MSDGAHAQEAETPVVKASMASAAAPGGRVRARDRKPCQGNACTSPEREGGEGDTSGGASGIAPGAARPFFLAIQANARRVPLADASIQCVVTSPPYWGLRAYSTAPQTWEDGWVGEYGSEPTPELYVAHTVEIFREVRRVLRPDGTVFLNLGDCYATKPIGVGSTHDPKWPNGRNRSEGFKCGRTNRPADIGLKHKDQVLIPHRVAMALQADGWWLRDTIIWSKPNPMPSSVTDRTTTAHEYLFLLTKNARYFYDADAIREPVTSTGGASFGGVVKGPILNSQGKRTVGRRVDDPSQRNHPLGRNKRSVWTIATQSFHGAHFATFPIKLVTPCILAGTSEKGCCPSCGSPWKRVVERIDVEGKGGLRKQVAAWDKVGKTSAFITGDWKANVTTHWLPSCKCPTHAPRPCIVFDPFGGAATTAVAAKRLGRSAIVTELNADYIAMGIKRYQEDKPKPEKRTRARASTVDLFTLAGGAA